MIKELIFNKQVVSFDSYLNIVTGFNGSGIQKFKLFLKEAISKHTKFTFGQGNGYRTLSNIYKNIFEYDTVMFDWARLVDQIMRLEPSVILIDNIDSFDLNLRNALLDLLERYQHHQYFIFSYNVELIGEIDEIWQLEQGKDLKRDYLKILKNGTILTGTEVHLKHNKIELDLYNILETTFDYLGE